VGTLVSGAAGWSVGALLLLIACKGVAYALCLSSFRGGPIFPAIFIGAAGGIAAAGLPGMSLVPGVAMGMGAMTTVMLGLPLTATLVAALLLGTGALNALPLVIVAVVVAYVADARLSSRLAGKPRELHPHRVMPGGGSAGAIAEAENGGLDGTARRRARPG
jgi:hypothetical protein